MTKRVNIYFPDEEQHQKAVEQSRKWNIKTFGRNKANLSSYTVWLYNRDK